MPRNVQSLGEFGLINSVKKYQCPTSFVVHGIGDDAAVLQLDAGRYQLFTTDMLIEGVHFTRHAPAKLVGHKALACNISDIAAMGGLPTCAVVSIGLSPKLTVRYVQDLYSGMSALAAQFNVSIAGGDTVRSDKLVINIALLGEVEKKCLVLRSGAKPGDMIFVTGPLGNTLRSGKHLDFMPRIKEARFLVEYFRPTAMMDISDGLAGDLAHILKASGVGALLESDMIPINPGATLASALTGGEDFELLFTIPSTCGKELIDYTKNQNRFSFIHVGTITGKAGKCLLKDRQGLISPVVVKAYAHF